MNAFDIGCADVDLAEGNGLLWGGEQLRVDLERRVRQRVAGLTTQVPVGAQSRLQERTNAAQDAILVESVCTVD